MSEKDYVWVKVKVGDPWLPGFEKVGLYGGWSNEGNYVFDDLVLQMERHGGAALWMKDMGYPAENSGWFKRQFDENNCFKGEEGDSYDDAWFCIPPELFDEVYGPKFNEYGEVSP